MGNKRVTVRRLQVVQIDEENNLLLVKGSVPGAPGGYVLVTRTN
jgi:large subunit ribosomal protein L3